MGGQCLSKHTGSSQFTRALQAERKKKEKSLCRISSPAKEEAAALGDLLKA